MERRIVREKKANKYYYDAKASDGLKVEMIGPFYHASVIPCKTMEDEYGSSFFPRLKARANHLLVYDATTATVGLLEQTRFFSFPLVMPPNWQCT